MEEISLLGLTERGSCCISLDEGKYLGLESNVMMDERREIISDDSASERRDN